MDTDLLRLRDAHVRTVETESKGQVDDRIGTEVVHG